MLFQVFLKNKTKEQAGFRFIKDTKLSLNINRSLKGTRQIGYECSELGIPKKETQEYAGAYTRIVEGAIKTLKATGYKPPKSKPELQSLWNAAGELMWKQFSYSELNTLSAGISSGRLDCYASMQMAWDILNGLGLETACVALLGHSVLQVTIKGQPASFIETTIHDTGKKSILNQEELGKKYPWMMRVYRQDALNPMAYIGLGMELAARGRWPRAFANFDKAARLDPKNLALYLNRSAALCDNRQYDAAIADSKKAIELAPKFYGGHAGLGVACLHAGRLDEALASLNKAIELNPKNPRSYRARGHVYQRMGDKERANEDFRRADEIGR